MSIVPQRNPIIGIVFDGETPPFSIEQVAEILKIILDELHLRAQILVDGLPFLPPQPEDITSTVLEKRIVIDITQEA